MQNFPKVDGLGFDLRATGKFDDNTRSVIKRWQASRGYSVTGFLNTLQHKALLGEIVSTRVASADDSASGADDSGSGHRYHRSSSSSGGRHYCGGGGPGGLFGHMTGGSSASEKMRSAFAKTLYAKRKGGPKARLFIVRYRAPDTISMRSRMCRSLTKKSARCAPKTALANKANYKSREEAKQRP